MTRPSVDRCVSHFAHAYTCVSNNIDDQKKNNDIGNSPTRRYFPFHEVGDRLLFRAVLFYANERATLSHFFAEDLECKEMEQVPNAKRVRLLFAELEVVDLVVRTLGITRGGSIPLVLRFPNHSYDSCQLVQYSIFLDNSYGSSPLIFHFSGVVTTIRVRLIPVFPNKWCRLQSGSSPLASSNHDESSTGTSLYAACVRVMTRGARTDQLTVSCTVT